MWRVSGQDPWRLYNGLDDDYRPLADPEAPAFRPKHPERLRRFMYAMGQAAAIIDGKVEDRGPQKRRMAPAPRRSRVIGPDGRPLEASA